MRHWVLATICAVPLAMAGCENLTSEQRTVAGAAAGLITTEAFGAGSEWRLISALAGAAAGTVVAQNQNRTVCAYARGDGTYYEVPCP